MNCPAKARLSLTSCVVCPFGSSEKSHLRELLNRESALMARPIRLSIPYRSLKGTRQGSCGPSNSPEWISEHCWVEPELTKSLHGCNDLIAAQRIRKAVLLPKSRRKPPPSWTPGPLDPAPWERRPHAHLGQELLVASDDNSPLGRCCVFC